MAVSARLHVCWAAGLYGWERPCCCYRQSACALWRQEHTALYGRALQAPAQTNKSCYVNQGTKCGLIRLQLFTSCMPATRSKPQIGWEQFQSVSLSSCLLGIENCNLIRIGSVDSRGGLGNTFLGPFSAMLSTLKAEPSIDRTGSCPVRNGSTSPAIGNPFGGPANKGDGKGQGHPLPKEEKPQAAQKETPATTSVSTHYDTHWVQYEIPKSHTQPSLAYHAGYDWAQSCAHAAAAPTTTALQTTPQVDPAS